MATIGLATSTVVASATPAAADVPCSINGITPTSVVVGLSPKTVRFDVRTSYCSKESWNINMGNYDAFVYDGGPYYTFQPFSNSDAGGKSVVVEAYNADFDSVQRSWGRGFYLKHNMAWQRGSFNASPEPVRKGKPIRIKGRLLVANWEANRYTAANGRSVAVQFRTPTGKYATVKTVRTGSTGWVDTTVTARRTGVWRVLYSGSSIA